MAFWMESVVCAELGISFTFLLDYLCSEDLFWTKEVAMPGYCLSDEMHIVYQEFRWIYLYPDTFTLCVVMFSVP